MISAFFRRTLPCFTQLSVASRQMNFSEYFAERDKQETILYYDEKASDKGYLRLRDKWKIDLAKKQARRSRKVELDKLRTKTPPQESKLVIHNPLQTVEIPPNPNEMFAIVVIGSKQYKVTKDDLIMVEHLKGLDINQTIQLDQILMIGTKHYTSMGRPIVSSAKILATVEQQTLSEKQIVFKKRRRKHYQKSYGHRQRITLLRINEIQHNCTQTELNRAVSLI